jgi:hypothetical protein
MKCESDGEVPLALAAQSAGLSWAQAWRLVLRGELEGRKAKGRWVVTRASLDAWHKAHRIVRAAGRNPG